MSTFDAEVFTNALMAEARELARNLGDEAAELRGELNALAMDVEATLAALEVERDGRRALALRQDLETFLPARKASILSVAASRASTDAQAALEKALTIASRIAVIVARAFVTS